MRTKIISSVLISCLLSLSLALAFGVSSPCWEGNPVSVNPGEEKVINLNVQNMAGATEDVTVKIEVTQGQDIASLEQDQFDVAAGAMKDIPLTLKIPSNAKPGESYSFRVDAKTIPSGTTGGVGMGVGMKIVCNAVVVQPVKGKTNTTLYLIVVLLVIAVAIYLMTRKKEKK